MCDWIDEAAHNLVVFGVTQRARRRRGSRPTSSCAPREHLDVAVGRLEGFKDSKTELIALRASRTRATSCCAPPSPSCSAPSRTRSSIIRWKDIHETLEGAVDALENAADVLEAILVKNR